jgi:phage terminase large subunit-like protein
LTERAMTFADLLPNICGSEAKPPLRLTAWQRLAFADLFGFPERETGARRFRQWIVFVSYGDGKLHRGSPGALPPFMDSERDAKGYSAAVTRDQARICLGWSQHDGFASV